VVKVSGAQGTAERTDKEAPVGKIVSNFFISLDGVVESPDQWHFPYFNDEMGDAIGKGMEATEALLMGRVLYEEWAAYWPTSTDEPIASIFNNMPKYVVSGTLREATWSNTTIISGDVAPAIRDLKDRTKGDITMSGSATLVRWLLANGLLDRLNLMVHPIAVGKGQRLFENTPTHPLQLVSQETFSTGVLNLGYAPADA
jgi:dihydrofolate reductase